MNPTEIEFAVRDIVAKPYDAGSFPYELIGIYNASKVTVSRLKSGTTNAAKQAGDVLWKKHLFFRSARAGEDVGAIADALAVDPLTAKHKPRFILVTNGEQVHARDLQLDDTLNGEFAKLDDNSDFLLPIAGFERRSVVVEHPADIKAAKKLKKLYESILSANPTWSSGHHTHELNLLMTRLLFCFYAEDTGIFETPQIFTNTVTQHTSEDGSDVAPLLDRLFRIMNVEEGKRAKTASAVDLKFPYVNGSLFEDTVEIPQFNRTARRQLLECGDLDWATINPDIFGSMIQTIAQDGTRGDLGMHYTSVPNIMKVLQPLFLDALHEAYEKAENSVQKLEELIGRLSKIRIFDPACGSGNFLIIAYKALRQLEIQALLRIGDIAPNVPLRLSGISLHNFYGIDVVDFACETAKLSLWIAEHQMNTAFKEVFGSARPTLPLGKIRSVHCGNAVRINWGDVCPPDSSAETYVCGNPPYLGVNAQTAEQKADTISIFSHILDGYTKVDYVSCWFVKLSDYISQTQATTGAFVASNSICQGEQVAFLWPYVFTQGLHITFAHTSFKWANSASNNAGVACIIVGLGKHEPRPRKIFMNSHHATVENINAYLVPSPRNTIVPKRTKPISDLPVLIKGDEAMDGGHLILSQAQAQHIVAEFPQAKALLRPFWGSKDFLYNITRYVLWISDDQVSLAESIPPVADRIEKVRRDRKKGGLHAKRAVAWPHRFAFIHHQDVESLVIPETTSERRQYLQVGLLGPLDISSHGLYVIYSPKPHLLSLLSSRLHRLWTETVGGKLENRLRYSSGLAYNTFPVPNLSKVQQQTLGAHSRLILKARAKHPGKSTAWLYNPETMPANLLEAHRENDVYVEECIYGRVFKDDTHRLEHLFNMYSTMSVREDTPLLATASTKKKDRK